MAFTSSSIKGAIEKSIGQGKSPIGLFSADNFKPYAEQLRATAWGFIHAYIRSFPIDAIIIGEVEENRDGAVIQLYFNKDKLWRDSLLYDGTGTKYGVDDIVLHFEKGWKAKRQTFGYWKSRNMYTYSRKQRDGTGMLASAIRSFNATAPDGVRASLNSPYK